jgi:hypothetical protein
MERTIDTSHCESSEPASSLEELEAILINRINGISNSAAPNTASDAPSVAIPNQRENDVAWLTHRYESLVVRLALLEENVARMCNVLGRIEPEFAAFRSTLGRDEK